MSREQHTQSSGGRPGLLARLLGHRARRAHSGAPRAAGGAASPRWDAYDVYFMALGPRR